MSDVLRGLAAAVFGLLLGGLPVSAAAAQDADESAAQAEAERAAIAERIKSHGQACLQGQDDSDCIAAAVAVGGAAAGGGANASGGGAAANGAAAVASADAGTGAQASVRSAARSGEAVYNTACLACHAAGIANAPKLGDAAAWAERIAKGRDVLNNSGINGIPGTTMLPRGGCPNCTDAEIIAAVDYMLENSQ